MKETIKETIKEIRVLLENKNSLVSKLKNQFNDQIQEIFKNHPDVYRILIPINNHEFNDGNATVFSIDACDMMAFDKKDDDIDNDHKVYDDINELFDLTDFENIHESWFGHKYGEIEFKRTKDKKG